MRLLIQAVAAIRVFGGIVQPGLYLAIVHISGLLWSAAFGR